MLIKNKGFRTCLYSNKQYNRQELIRFVKQDNKLIIDKECKLPGRGYWVKVTKEALDDPKFVSILSKKTRCSIDPDIKQELMKLI